MAITLGIAGLASVSGGSQDVRALLPTTEPSHASLADTVQLNHFMCRELDSLAVARSRGKDTTSRRDEDARFRQLRDTTFANWLADCRRRRRVANLLEAEGERLVDIHWSIAEFHDEQRLRYGKAHPAPVTDTHFGPVVFFYAMPHAETYTDINQIEAQWPLGTLAGILLVDALPADTLPTSYQRLDLRSGLNCLWLAHRPGTDSMAEWHAYVAPASATRKCERPQQMPTALAVKRTRPSPNEADYPAAVRFTEGTFPEAPGAAGSSAPAGAPAPQSVQPLLVVKCLAGSCEIGPKGFGSSQSLGGQFPSVPSVQSVIAQWGNAREATIPGWHDAQWLGVEVGGVLEPRVYAAIIPTRNLVAISGPRYALWRRVATILLSADPPPQSKYARWGLRAGINYLEIRGASGGWTARLVQPGAASYEQWYLVRTPHFDEAVPGTARFRYTSFDDGVWVPCNQACCQSGGGDS